jgi:hypothetical protein
MNFYLGNTGPLLVKKGKAAEIFSRYRLRYPLPGLK